MGLVHTWVCRRKNKSVLLQEFLLLSALLLRVRGRFQNPAPNPSTRQAMVETLSEERGRKILRGTFVSLERVSGDLWIAFKCKSIVREVAGSRRGTSGEVWGNSGKSRELPEARES